MHAVVKIAGQQYTVAPNDKIFVPKLKAEIGATVTFNDVLVLTDDQKSTVGSPFIKGASVEAKVLAQVKDDKIFMFTMKKRKDERKSRGHRQQYTQIEITKVG